MSSPDELNTQPESIESADATGQGSGAGHSGVRNSNDEGILPCTLDQAMDQMASENKRLTVNTFFRFIGAWGRDWQSRVEENASLRERVARLEGEKSERGKYKTLVSLTQAGGTAVVLLGIGMVSEGHAAGWVLILIGGVLLGSALWANRGDPA